MIRPNRSGRSERGESSHKNGYINQSDQPPQSCEKSARPCLRSIFDEKEVANWELLVIVRVAAFVTWTGSVLFATYHVFQACQEHLQWNSDPVMNPSLFSRILNRGKDNTDYEWEMFMSLYGTLWIWYGMYVIMTRIVQTSFPEAWRFVSPGLSFLMFWNIVGLRPLVFLILQPVIYWIFAQTRSKLLIWAVTVAFIYQLNSALMEVFRPNNSYSEYFFIVTAAWNCARGVSYSYDIWEKAGDQKLGLNFLLNGIWYCFYLPLAITGPLVTYNSFEENIINNDKNAIKQRDTFQDFYTVMKKLLHIICIGLLNEIILHILYFRSLSMTTSIHSSLNLWAICGTIYWLGNFFAMKYKVLYGVPTCIAEFDGMIMHPLPRCPSYLHRYSVLWRDFDRGLYRFLVNYIYLPILKYIKDLDKTNTIPRDVQKLIASFATFVYVYMWHSLSFDVFVWAALNFLGITIERIGSVIKREIDKRTVITSWIIITTLLNLNPPIEPLMWDFVIEPFVTIPLAAMSILNSSIFCGSLEAATSFTLVLWQKRQDSYIFIFLFCFTHTAVTYRTWGHKIRKLLCKTKLK